MEISGLSSFKYLVEERKLDANKLQALADKNKVVFKEKQIEIFMRDFDDNCIPKKKGT